MSARSNRRAPLDDDAPRCRHVGVAPEAIPQRHVGPPGHGGHQGGEILDAVLPVGVHGHVRGEGRLLKRELARRLQRGALTQVERVAGEHEAEGRGGGGVRGGGDERLRGDGRLAAVVDEEDGDASQLLGAGAHARERGGEPAGLVVGGHEDGDGHRGRGAYTGALGATVRYHHLSEVSVSPCQRTPSHGCAVSTSELDHATFHGAGDRRMSDAIHDNLVQSGTFAPAPLDGPGERSWLDWDLASLAENRLGDASDPRDLDEARRAEWTARATKDRPWSLGRRSVYERCYWILEGAERVGTLAVGTGLPHDRRAHASSFYVLPAHRGRGIGRRALGRLEDVLARHHLSLRLDTCWCWPRTVRFYLGAGMWLYMWKRELTFFRRAGMPAHRIEVGEDTASLSVTLDDDEIVLARARRHGDALQLDEPPRELSSDKRIGDAYWHATTTLSLALALKGWPLIRSPEEWDRCHYADGGAPEGLAGRIPIWEAEDRAHGWRVETPRIPGLEYPTWSELEARWERERAEHEASIVRAPPEGDTG